MELVPGQEYKLRDKNESLKEAIKRDIKNSIESSKVEGCATELQHWSKFLLSLHFSMDDIEVEEVNLLYTLLVEEAELFKEYLSECLLSCGISTKEI